MATKSFVNVRYDVAKNWRISWNISGSTAPIFAFFTPYESALRADDGSVAYFHMSRDVAMATDEKCKKFGWFGGLEVTQGHRRHCHLIERI